MDTCSRNEGVGVGSERPVEAVEYGGERPGTARDGTEDGGKRNDW
jgi:hypothetical protein